MTTTRKERAIVLIFLGVGFLLLLVSLGYYAYGFFARSGLDNLNYNQPRPIPTMSGKRIVPDVVSAKANMPGSLRNIGDSGTQGEKVGPVNSNIAKSDDSTSTRSIVAKRDGNATDVAKAAGKKMVDSASPGINKEIKIDSPAVPTTVAFTFENTSEHNPLKLEGLNPGDFRRDPLRGSVEYAPLSALQAESDSYLPPGSFEPLGRSSPPIKIRIPAISVDSAVNQLAIVRISDSYAWQTPDKVVGHIPTTAIPGEIGQGWYFGHLESPIKGEGNVFSSLPGITTYLDAGQTVYVFIENADRKYMYQVYKTEVVHQDTLKITDSGKTDITLVTCVPRLFYDHRFLVTAALVGIREF